MNDDLEALKEAIQHTEDQPRDEQGKLTPEGQQAVQDKLGQKDSLSPVGIKQAVGEFMDALTQMIAEKMGESGQEPGQEEPLQGPSGPQGKSLEWRRLGRSHHLAVTNYGDYRIRNRELCYYSFDPQTGRRGNLQILDSGKRPNELKRVAEGHSRVRRSQALPEKGSEADRERVHSKALDWRDYGGGTHQSYGSYGHVYTIYRHPSGYHSLYMLSSHGPPSERVDTGELEEMQARANQHESAMRWAGPQQRQGTPKGETPPGEVGQQSLKSLKSLNWRETSPGTHFTMADNGAYRIHQGVLEHYPFDPVTTESGETQTLDRGKNSNTLKRVAHRHHQDTMREVRTRGLQRDVQQGVVHQPGQRLPGEMGQQSLKSLRGQYKATPAPLPSLNPGDRVVLSRLVPPLIEREVIRTQGVRPVSGHPEQRQVRTRTAYGREDSIPVDWLRRVGSDQFMNARRRLISLRHHVGLSKDTPNVILADKLRESGLDEHADWVQSYHPSGTVIHREGSFLVTQSPSSPYLSVHKVSDRNPNYGYPHTVVPTLEQAQQYIRSRSGEKSFFGTKSVVPPRVHSKSLVMSTKAWRWTRYDNRHTTWLVQEGVTPIGYYDIFRDRDTGMHQLMWNHRPADRNRPDYGAGPFLVGEHQDPAVLRTMAREHFRRVSKAPPPGPQQMAGTRKGERPPGEIGQASLKGLNMSTKAHPAVGMIRQFKQTLRSGTPDLQALHIIADSLEESGHQHHAERLRDLAKFYWSGSRHGTSGRSIKNALDDATADVSGKARSLRWHNIDYQLYGGDLHSFSTAGHGQYSVRYHHPDPDQPDQYTPDTHELAYYSHQPLKEGEDRPFRGEILHVHPDPKVLQQLAREHNESPEVVKLPRPR